MTSRLIDVQLDESQKRLAEGILDLLDAPRNGFGALPAIQAVCKVLQALSDTRAVSGLSDFVIRVDKLEVQMLASVLPTHVRVVPDLSSASSAYRLMMYVASLGTGQVDELRVIGAVVLRHLLLGHPLKRTRSEQLTSIVRSKNRSGRRSDWIILRDNLGLDPNRLSAAIDKVSVDNVRDVGLWLVEIIKSLDSMRVPAELLDVARCLPNVTSPHTMTMPKSHRVRRDVESGQLVKWAQMRAVRGATLAGTAGLNDWSNLTPNALRPVVRRLAESQDSYSLCALLSLATGLPLKLVLNLPFECNDDIWIDPLEGRFVWCLSALVARESVVPEVAERGHSPREYITVPLPDIVAKALKSYGEQGQTVRDRLFLGIPIEEITARYGAALRAKAEEYERTPYASRFAYSLGGVIADIAGDSVAAAYACLDFRHVAVAELNYICISVSRIWRALEKSYNWLGLGKLAGELQGGYVGSPLTPRKDVAFEIVRSLEHKIRAVDPRGWRRKPIESVIEDFNCRAALMCALFVFVTGERGTKIERRTFGALYGSHDFVMVADKGVSGWINPRPIPTILRIKRILSTLRADIAYLVQIMMRAKVEKAWRVERLARLQRPNAPVFFTVALTSSGSVECRLSPILAEHVERVLSDFCVVRNSGRHYLLSVLSDPKYPPYLRRALSGHGMGAGYAYHATSGVSVLSVIRDLQLALEEVWAGSEVGDDWPCVKACVPGSPPLIYPNAVLGKENRSLSAFSNFKLADVGYGDAPFALMSGAAYQLATRIRYFLLSEFNELSVEAVLLLCMAMVDGLSDMELLRTAWLHILSRRSMCIGSLVVSTLPLASGRSRLYVPLRPTLMALQAVLECPAIPSFDAVVESVVRVLRKEFREIGWPKDSQGAMHVVLGLANHLTRFEILGWIVSAESPQFGSASITAEALTRLYTGRPLLRQQVSCKSNVKPRRRRLYGAIDLIVRMVQRCANPLRRYGEDVERKNRLRLSIDRLEERLAITYPMVQALIDYVRAELKRQPLHGNVIVIRTIATYVGGLFPLFDSRVFEHPLEFDADDWLALQGEFATKMSDQQGGVDYSSLRRFAHYWLMYGAEVPRSLFAATEAWVTRKAPLSTASRYLWRHEWETVVSLVLKGLEVGTLKYELWGCYLDLNWAVPLRAREVALIRLQDLDVNCQSVTITSSGFGHLKGGDRSRGTVQLPSELVDRLGVLRCRLLSVSPNREYFFVDLDLRDDDFVEIVGRLSTCLVYVTGEPYIRRHVMRGVTESRLLLGDDERFVANVIDGSYDGLQRLDESNLESWRAVVRTAQAARHHPLTAISSYLVLWPLIGYVLRAQALGSIWPGPFFVQRGGVSPNYMRVIKHRILDARGSAMDGWGKVIKTIDIDAMAAEHISVANPEAVNPPHWIAVTGNSVKALDESLAREIWWNALILGGLGERAATDITGFRGVGDRRSVNLSKVGGAVRLLRIYGLDVARRLVDVGDAAHFERARKALSIEDRVVPSSLDQLLASMRSLLSLMPSDWRLVLRPESEGVPLSSEPLLRSYARSLVIKRPAIKRAARYRYLVLPPGTAIGPKPQGEATRALAALLEGAVYVLSNYKNG